MKQTNQKFWLPILKKPFSVNKDGQDCAIMFKGKIQWGKTPWSNELA